MRRGVAALFALAIASTCAVADSKDIESTFQRGYDAWFAGDIVGAMPPLKTAADAGHAKAQALYGALLDHADNDAEAAVYYKKAADQGDPDGAFGLASFYMTGDTGERDPSKALPLFQLAVEKGHMGSIKTLAQNYLANSFSSLPETRFAPETWRLVRIAADKEELDFMVILEQAYREGNPQVQKDIAAADALKAKIDKALGLDVNKKKRRRR